MNEQNSPEPGGHPNVNLPGQPTPLQSLSGADLEKLLNPSRVLSREEYAALHRDVPIPSALQRANFVEYITTAHSWYKHLPRYLPGAPFYLFIDRFAGCGWQAGFFVEKKERGEHYSDVTTAEHRTRFGFLSYCPDFAAIRLLEGERPEGSWDELVAELGKYAQLSAMPRPILEAGRVEITAVIHPLSHSDHYWIPRNSQILPKVHWPSESGGETTLAKLFERCTEMRQPGFKREENHKPCGETLELRKAKGNTIAYYYSRADPVLHELLEPERERQKNEMLKAIDRNCKLIHEASLPAT